MRKCEERMMRFFCVGVVWSTALFGATGCMDQGSEPTGEEVYYFSSLERDKWQPREIIDQSSAQISPEELEQLKPIFAGFEKNAEQLFEQPDIDKRLEAIENAYIRSGRYLKILSFYKTDIERQGVSKSPAAPRFLWGLIRLGQESQARDFAQKLVGARPDDADAWFLFGAYWIKFAAADSEAAKKVVAGWRRTVELNPAYLGFEGIDAMTMRREIARLKSEHRLKDADIDAMIAELAGSGEERAVVASEQQVQDALVAAKTGVGPVKEEAVVDAPAVDTPPGESVKEEASPSEDAAKSLTDNGIKAPPSEDIKPREQETAPERSVQQQLLLAMAEANLMWSSGEQAQARARLQEGIKNALPEGKIENAGAVLTRGVDQFSLVRACWKMELDRTGAAKLFRGLAQGDEKITSMALYKRVRFAVDELNDYALGKELIAKLKAQDSDFAARYKVDSLIK